MKNMYHSLFSLLLLLSTSLLPMQQAPISLQEKLNNDKIILNNETSQSEFALAFRITDKLMQEQIDTFNVRMINKGKGISATYEYVDNNNIVINFFMQFPHSRKKILFHQNKMPISASGDDRERAISSQLKRRFEGLGLEDHVEKVKCRIEDEAIKKFKKKWKTKVFFKIIPRVIDTCAEKIGADMAQSIARILPFSFTKRLQTNVINEQEIVSLIDEAQQLQEKASMAQLLSELAHQTHQHINAMPEQEKEKRKLLEEKLSEAFCSTFEKQLAQ